MAVNLTTPGPGNEPEVMLDINTTPLIDVMLVLLIMLIITIPVQLHAVRMDMPASAPPAKTQPQTVRIEVDARNTVRWNGKPLADREALLAQLHEAAALEPQPEIHIRADGHAKYATVAAVLAGAQREGLQKIGVVGVSQFASP